MTDPATLRLAPDEFGRLVEKALDDLPEEFARALANIAVVIEDKPDPELLAEYGFDTDEELLGLYEGVPLPERDSFYQSLPDRISIFRGPILRYCRSRREVIREVRETVVHEIGHYFGFDEEDLP